MSCLLLVQAVQPQEGSWRRASSAARKPPRRAQPVLNYGRAVQLPYTISLQHASPGSRRSRPSTATKPCNCPILSELSTLPTCSMWRRSGVSYIRRVSTSVVRVMSGLLCSRMPAGEDHRARNCGRNSRQGCTSLNDVTFALPRAHGVQACCTAHRGTARERGRRAESWQRIEVKQATHARCGEK